MIPQNIGTALTAEGRALRVGLLAVDWHQPSWVSAMVESLVAETQLNLQLCLVEPENQVLKDCGLLSRVVARVRLAYRHWIPDSRHIPLGPAPGPHADEVVDLAPLLKNVPVISLRLASDNCGRIEDQSIATIRSEQFDVLVALGDGPWTGELQRAARWGLWIFRPGFGYAIHGVPAGAWEVMEQQSITIASLQILGLDNASPQFLRRGATSTCQWSIRANWNLMYWHSVRWVAEALRELWRDGEVAWEAHRLSNKSQFPTLADRTYGRPTARDIRRFARRQQALIAREQEIDRTMMRQWVLLYNLGAPGPATGLSSFKRLTPPTDRVWADPFVVKENDRYVILFEEHLLSRKHAHLCAMYLEADGTFTQARVILERPYHLSYPFVFKYEHQWYMIPETRGNRSVELYRAIEFPWRWEFYKILISGLEAVDATLWAEGGQWWMFVGVQEKRGAYSWTNLHLYYSEDPVQGAWRPHPLNPVVEDVRSSRPGGCLYRHQGKLIRPAQDGSIRYGYGLHLNEVVTLTTNYYEERSHLVLTPDWAEDVCGVHTLNHVDMLTMADARILRTKSSLVG